MDVASRRTVRGIYRPFYALAELWAIVRGGLWIVLGCVALCTVLAVAVAYLLPVKYRAEALLKPAQSDSNLTSQLLPQGLASLAGIKLNVDDRSAEAKAFLESKAFTMDFVHSNQLLPVLFPKKWDAAKGAWRSDDPKRIPTDLDAYKLFRDDLRTVTQDGQTGLVMLSIEWTDPELAAHWVNDMVKLLNEKMRSDAVDRSRRNLEFLRKEYEDTTVAPLREAIARLMESELQTSMLASVQQDYAFRVIDPAVVPNRRISPNRPLIAAAGLAVGLALGFLVAIGRAMPPRGAAGD